MDFVSMISMISKTLDLLYYSICFYIFMVEQKQVAGKALVRWWWGRRSEAAGIVNATSLPLRLFRIVNMIV